MEPNQIPSEPTATPRPENTQVYGPQVVHISRAMAPVREEVSPEIKAKHDESMRRFPSLNISEAEYVISAVRRHWIGLLIPVGLTVFMIAFVMAAVINYPLIMSALGFDGASGYGWVLLAGGLVSILFALGGYIAAFVYNDNHFYLTNESVVQEIRRSLFSRSEQTVSLANIEDASYQQNGLVPSLLDYGSIRLSTEGDETTYRFAYVTHPKQEIALLNNAIEAFKNGRPVEE